MEMFFVPKGVIF